MNTYVARFACGVNAPGDKPKLDRSSHRERRSRVVGQDELRTAHAERMLEILVRTGAVAVEGYGEGPERGVWTW
jgi:hypothetical protein